MADTTTPDLPRTSAAVAESTIHDPDARGHFGVFGGRYVAEALMAVIEEVTAAYDKARTDQKFLDELDSLHLMFDHMVDGIAAGPTDAQHLDDGTLLLGVINDFEHGYCLLTR